MPSSSEEDEKTPLDLSELDEFYFTDRPNYKEQLKAAKKELNASHQRECNLDEKLEAMYKKKEAYKALFLNTRKTQNKLLKTGEKQEKFMQRQEKWLQKQKKEIRILKKENNLFQFWILKLQKMINPKDQGLPNGAVLKKKLK